MLWILVIDRGWSHSIFKVLIEAIRVGNGDKIRIILPSLVSLVPTLKIPSIASCIEPPVKATIPYLWRCNSSPGVRC